MREIHFGVFRERFIYTKNLIPGKKVYGERLHKEDKVEYRSFDPYRSKLGAAIMKRLQAWPFKQDSVVLYLGASTGSTISHLSDICTKGEIYGVEISPHVIDKLINLSEKRENIIPILADANKPKEYEEVGKVDIIYEDVAQKNQAEILIKNSKMFLKKGGIAMIAIKSQSIDVVKDPKQIFKQVKKELKDEFELIEEVDIDSYDKGHTFLVLKKR